MNLFLKAKNQLMTNWFVCGVTSGRKSVQYGIRFSYPLFISVVALGVFLVNPYILSVAALIAFFGIKLPMHPFDYVYNYGVARLFRVNQIPGRGSELHVSSGIAFLFTLAVIVSIIYKTQLNYGLMALIFVFINILFIVVPLFTDGFSIHSIYKIFKKSK